ncbi:hypothetical protein NIIDMKKI_41250 [Mycobacterium kansasii]|uniref:Methylmalonyl-CoA mutase alpha/beta chain catalytic domain-containing protein n=1 Tax=Mycobacterium kansasii TaxID=1768 RepID=A0A7G1IGW9_MYCKA|nr:hypothetical protein NIIDMKKI_41250 [Mycobacterium kansasii]
MTTTAPVVGSFADVPLHGDRAVPPATENGVDELVAAAAAAHSYQPEQLHWHTPEGIDVKPVYIAADRGAAAAQGYPLHSFPGEPPYVRGPYPTMYVNQPWTIRQYAGFSTAADSNAFYRRNLAAGQRVSRWPSTWPPTAATTRTIRGCRAMSEWPAWQSIPFST